MRIEIDVHEVFTLGGDDTVPTVGAVAEAVERVVTATLVEMGARAAWVERVEVSR